MLISLWILGAAEAAPVQNQNIPTNPEPARAPRAKKGEFVDSRIGAGVAAAAAPSAPAQGQSGGFGDTGASSVKINHAPGGKSSGNILSWT
eukprot:CAMPEP_0202807380 /NCGR_PEP_ID=MMETSP1389-20130828/66_1 /ASSEMBLY_ACC=CAM_ASM_000865 /TAXON_ID=302021 /ORGANISM="Rhodomonas sp., Strain CCMP768" /LENGTH=90 /DNA_ID=CAMNT_0049477377 /DNA_START=120 /DNA_END=393 /DNA_ORIENTATION=+